MVLLSASLAEYYATKANKTRTTYIHTTVSIAGHYHAGLMVGKHTWHMTHGVQGLQCSNEIHGTDVRCAVGLQARHDGGSEVRSESAKQHIRKCTTRLPHNLTAVALCHSAFEPLPLLVEHGGQDVRTTHSLRTALEYHYTITTEHDNVIVPAWWFPLPFLTEGGSQEVPTTYSLATL